MIPVYVGIIKAILIAGLGVLLAIALSWLPDSPKARRLKGATLAWAFLGATFLLTKAYFIH